MSRSSVWVIAFPLLAGCAVGMAPSSPSGVRADSSGLVLTKAYAKKPAHTELATFAAGCFWGAEDAFRTAPGVVATMVGYSGGHVKNPTYEEVCTHTTGHAESVEVLFDTDKTNFDKMLKLFFSIHDATLVDRQGPDVGDNYRSAVFYHSAKQKQDILNVIQQLSKTKEYRGEKIATEVAAAGPFYRAEEYHQQYVDKGGVAYCHPRHKQ